MKKLFLLIPFLFLFSCKWEETPDEIVNKMTPPIILLAESPEVSKKIESGTRVYYATITVIDSLGYVKTFNASTQFARSIGNTFNPGDTIVKKRK